MRRPRPPVTLPTFLFVLTGYVLKIPHDWQVLIRDLLLLFFTYSVFMWGGANAFNSSQGRDNGPINLLPNPPPVPKHLAAFGIVWMGCGVLLSLLKGPIAFLLTLGGFLASIYYSWIQPHWKRGKEIPGIDILINAGGCGLGSVLAGYAFTGGHWEGRVFWVGVAFTVAIFGGLPPSQIFQLAPDYSGTKENNYSSCLGPQKTLRIGSFLFVAHLLILSWIAVHFGEPDHPSPLASFFFWGWFGLVFISAVHSFWWSYSPFIHAYSRMIRQFVLMSVSQVCWIVFIWIQFDS